MLNARYSEFLAQPSGIEIKSTTAFPRSEIENRGAIDYAKLTFDVSDRLSLTAGLRFTHERKTLGVTSVRACPGTLTLASEEKREDLAPDPRIGLTPLVALDLGLPSFQPIRTTDLLTCLTSVSIPTLSTPTLSSLAACETRREADPSVLLDLR